MQNGHVTFPGGSAFLTDVRGRVDAKLASMGTTGGGDVAMHAKTVFWLGAAALTYAAVLVTAPSLVSFLAWPLLGFCMACIGFNVGHDAIHGSYSKKPWVNAVFSRAFDLMGASSTMWTIAHNQIHHSFTNVVGIDTDLDPGPFMRFAPKATQAPRVLRFQHFYAWALYGLTGIVWVFVKDIRQLIEHRARPMVVVEVMGWKLAHLTLFLVVPMLVAHAILPVIAGYLFMLATAGVTLAVVFQLAHVVELVGTVPAPATAMMSEPWADHEMRVTANFGRTPFTTFITGGLDHQIEHHLFPRICHTHYRALAPIVEACAREHGLPYFHSGTFITAVRSHARLLRTLGAAVPIAPGESVVAVAPVVA